MPEWSPDAPAPVRREQIISLVEQKGFARVVDLSRLLQLSEVTIRSDLDYLAESGAVQRVHGGAIASTRTAVHEPGFELAITRAVAEKRRIGVFAASLVESDQAVLLDAGTTTLAMARALRDREDLTGVVVFTNSLTIALELSSEESAYTVIVTGGTVRYKQRSLVDPLGDMFLGNVHGDLCFIGCNGISAQNGVTNASLPEVTMKRRFLDSARKKIVLADSSKIGQSQLMSIAPLSNIDLLVTGHEASEQHIHELNDAELPLELV